MQVDALKQVNNSLISLFFETGATYACLMDRNYQVISSQGDETCLQKIPEKALEELKADLAVWRDVRNQNTIAAQTPLWQSNAGAVNYYFTEPILDQWVIVLVFSKRVHSGLMRMLSKKAVEHLTYS